MVSAGILKATDTLFERPPEYCGSDPKIACWCLPPVLAVWRDKHKTKVVAGLPTVFVVRTHQLVACRTVGVANLADNIEGVRCAPGQRPMQVV